MGQIGNYVHAHGANYNSFWLGRKERAGMSVGQAITQANQDAYAHIKKTNANLKAQDLSEFLTHLIYNKGDLTKGNLSIDANQIKALEDQFEQLINEKFPQLQAHLDNLSFSSAVKMGGDFKKVSTTTKEGVEKGTLDRIASDLDLLLNNLKNITKSNSKNKLSKLTELQSKAEALKSQMATLIAKNKNARSVHSRIASTAQGGADNDLLVQYNELIKSIQGPTNEQLGTLAEAYFAFMLQSLSGTTEITTDQLFNQFVTGAKGSGQVLSNIDLGIGAMLQTKMNTSIDSKTGKTKVASGGQMQWQWDQSTGKMQWTGTSQGTVDMSLTFPEDSELANAFGVNKLNASIKNYASTAGFQGGGVHIIRGYPLLSALMLFNTDFVNHYLNLIASHEIDDVNFKIPSSMNETIQKGIAVRALSGARDMGNINNDLLSDAFIVNAREEARVYVYTTKDLIDKLWSNIQTYTELEGMPGGLVSMKWLGGDPDASAAGERIANLLADIHAFKLSMSLKPAVFSS